MFYKGDLVEFTFPKSKYTNKICPILEVVNSFDAVYYKIELDEGIYAEVTARFLREIFSG